MPASAGTSGNANEKVQRPSGLRAGRQHDSCVAEVAVAAVVVPRVDDHQVDQLVAVEVAGNDGVLAPVTST